MPPKGEPVVVDGPFVEAPGYVGGFWVIEAADLDAAVRWATQASKHWVAASRCAPFRTRRTPDRTQTPATCPALRSSQGAPGSCLGVASGQLPKLH